MKKDEIQESLDKFKEAVVRESKKNLQKQTSTGTLADSLVGKAKVSPNSIEVAFTMKAYGVFQDRGVKGKKSGNSLDNYAYTDKKPPASAFSQWAIKKFPEQTRNSKGQFVSRKSLQFALANHIFNYGIKPTLFFTKPFEKHYKKLPPELLTKYGLKIDKLLKKVIDDNIKDIKQ